MSVNVGRIGLWTPSRAWPASRAERGRAAAEIEELGFGAVWLGGATADLELPASLLETTHRLVVGTGILNVWTEPVDVVIDTYGMIGRVHPDRLLLGIGAGHKEPVERMTGQRYENPYGKVVAYLDALEAAGIPRSVCVLAALGPRMLRLAGERTAGALPYLVTPDHTWRARRILGPGPLLAPEQKVVLESDPDRARRIARAGLEMYLTLPNYTNNLRRLGFTDADFADGGSDRLVDRLVAWGDIEAIRSHVSEHFEAGADHVAVQVLTEQPGALPRAQWRALAEGLRLAESLAGRPR